MTLFENERLDEVNDALKLIQKTDGLTFGTDALLLAAYITSKYKRAAELGGGSGIISMLLLSRERIGKAFCIELQAEYAELIGRNAELNGLAERLIPICSDVRDYVPECELDLVFTNPPYMKADSGRSCDEMKKTLARHEICGDIRDFCLSAKRMLKFGGTFAAVYRPDRLTDLISAMREAGLEPKRLTFVHADETCEPSMVLVLAKRGGSSGARITRPLIIYRDRAHREYGDDMNYIMENGIFPKEYKL